MQCAFAIISSLFVILFVNGCLSQNSQLKTLQINHVPHDLSNSDLRYLSNLSNVRYTQQVLNKILIPRVVGTQNHRNVFSFIKSELEKLDWNIEVDEFQDEAPRFGVLTFRNIVASLNPDADRFLVLACHYDSKYFENEVFVGATDSAVPCAMLLNLAKVMRNELQSIKNNSNVSLKLIFFDGEEAFVQWNNRDSIYGARHLASKYHNQVASSKSTGEAVNELQKMDMLVLLDLIGHRDVKFYSYFTDTSKWFLRMADAEDRLDNLRLLTRHNKYFIKRMSYSHIEDDHIPFLHKGVPILHLISSPFPREWHTPDDNKDIIDYNAVENINKILRVFIAEYFHIYLSDTSEGHIPEKEL